MKWIIWLALLLAGALCFGDSLRILVTPFTNNSQAEYGWLGYGIEASVIADLAQVEGVKVISVKDRKKALDELSYQLSGLVDEEKAVRAGKTLGANVILSGEYTVIGQDIRLTGRLSLVEKAEVIASSKLDGNINGIFELQDNIVIRLLSEIDEAKSGGLPRHKFADREIAAIKRHEGNFNSFEYNARGLEITENVSQEFLDIEQAIFNLINAERAKAGLKPYLYNSRLAALGRYHSMNMQVYNFFDFTDQNGMDSTGRKLVLAPELFGGVEQMIAHTYGGSVNDVAAQFVSQWMASDVKTTLLNPDADHVGVGIFRGDGDGFLYYCTVVPANLRMELVSVPPKKVGYGSLVTFKFKYLGTLPRDKVRVAIQFPDRNAEFYAGNGMAWRGMGFIAPQWDGDFFTITFKCDKGRGAYVIYSAYGDEYNKPGLTFIAQ